MRSPRPLGSFPSALCARLMTIFMHVCIVALMAVPPVLGSYVVLNRALQTSPRVTAAGSGKGKLLLAARRGGAGARAKKPLHSSASAFGPSDPDRPLSGGNPGASPQYPNVAIARQGTAALGKAVNVGYAQNTSALLSSVGATLSMLSTGSVVLPLTNAGFETPALGNGNFQYSPNAAGAGWNFEGGTGISANASGLTGGNPSAPEGQQVGFLQGRTTFFQSITVGSLGAVRVSFKAAQRQGYGQEMVQILLDGSVLGTYTPSSSSYASIVTPNFGVRPGTHVLTFFGMNRQGDDCTVFIDDVQVIFTEAPPAPVATSTILNSGFEHPYVGDNYGAYSYNTSDADWA
ncbi:MAG: hypothetical protein V4671_01925, partial [Armatimonadota bacterium]